MGDSSHPRHQAVHYEFGGLFHQYEPRFWWFQLLIMLNKMMMTGMLSVVAPGSPVQMLLATLVMMGHMLIVLKLTPYKKDSEDWVSFILCLVLVWTTLGCLILTLDEGNQYFDRDGMGMGIIVLSVMVFVLQLF